MPTSIEEARERVRKARERAILQPDGTLVQLLDDALEALSNDLLLTTSEVAQLLGIRSVNTVKALIRAGRIEAVKAGSHYRIPLTEVERLRHDATTQALGAASQLHAELDQLGLGKELTAAELEALSASRPGKLPWAQSSTSIEDPPEETHVATRHAS
jgi:excisionase family DNA binding protein